MKKSIALTLVILLVTFSALALDGKKTAYIGGTVPDLKNNTEGVSSAKNADFFVFEYKGGK